MLAVKSTLPKLNPVTVTDKPPLHAKLDKLKDTAGASKLTRSTPVPAIAPTVMLSMSSDAANTVVHRTLVLLDQLAVLHAPPESTDVCDKSVLPKLSPLTVTELPPLAAPFSAARDTAGPSNEKLLCPVPATAPTVTGKDALVLTMLPTRQPKDVLDCQERHTQPTPPTSTLAV
jgi:hypothetical protein